MIPAPTLPAAGAPPGHGHEPMYASHNGAVRASRTAESATVGHGTCGGPDDHKVSSLIVLLDTCATR